MKSGKQSGTSRSGIASRSERLGGSLVGTNPTPASGAKMIEQFGAQKTRLRQNLDFLSSLKFSFWLEAARKSADDGPLGAKGDLTIGRRE